ncbi:MAG: hypothetical protein JWQ30_1801 [Sediminibacterium sp.]|nr:hypothetical protein [Sediminibacterium sp.]
MRKLLLLAFMPMACMLAKKTFAHSYKLIDSVKVVHVTDGNIDEWKIEKFETDPETKIQHCIDHDGENLYVAMKISDQLLQAKIMTQGMSLLIDKKGKKKEGAGIQFPVKVPINGLNRGGGGSDPKQIREKNASMMVFFKAFGLDNLEEEKLYVISQSGLVNINFGWDEADNMYIEYAVPFIFIGATASLNGKPLSIGWKIPESGGGSGGGSSAAASSTPNNVVATTTTRVVAVPAGSAPPTSNTSSRGGRGGGAGRGGGGFEAAQESSGRNSYVWTKYVLTF